MSMDFTIHASDPADFAKQIIGLYGMLFVGNIARPTAPAVAEQPAADAVTAEPVKPPVAPAARRGRPAKAEGQTLDLKVNEGAVGQGGAAGTPPEATAAPVEMVETVVEKPAELPKAPDRDEVRKVLIAYANDYKLKNGGDTDAMAKALAGVYERMGITPPKLMHVPDDRLAEVLIVVDALRAETLGEV